MDIRAVVLDTETTSKESGREVIELAWAMFDCPAPSPGGITARYYGRYKPDGEIQLGAMATHHIIPGDLEGCPPSADAVTHMPGAVEYFIGHNVDFDAESLGIDGKCICTLAMSRALLPHLDSHTQTALIYYLGGLRGNLARARERVQEAHNAKADVENCITILLALVSMARKAGHEINSWDSLYAFSEECRTPSVMPFSKEHKGKHMSQVPQGFRDWYARQENTDRYILAAFNKYPAEA